MVFFSARLRFVVLIEYAEPRRTHIQDESVVVFRASSFEHAFERALDIGRSMEADYIGGTGRRVRWVLAEVLNIDRIGRRIDGVEVASRLDRVRSASPIPFGTRFSPELSKPHQSF